MMWERGRAEPVPAVHRPERHGHRLGGERAADVGPALGFSRSPDQFRRLPVFSQPMDFQICC
jgi:hypothetical protein